MTTRRLQLLQDDHVIAEREADDVDWLVFVVDDIGMTTINEFAIEHAVATIIAISGIVQFD